MTLDEAKMEVKRNQTRGPYLSEWKHLKTGGSYAIKMHVLMEATLEPCVVYYKKFADPLETWCRPASEFFDGRFARAGRDWASAPQPECIFCAVGHPNELEDGKLIHNGGREQNPCPTHDNSNRK
jgi:hypothetical protein